MAGVLYSILNLSNTVDRSNAADINEDGALNTLSFANYVLANGMIRSVNRAALLTWFQLPLAGWFDVGDDMAGRSGGYDPRDFNHDGKVGQNDAAEFEFNERWIQNHSSGNSSGSGDDAEGCCYLILIGAAIFLILGFIGMAL